MKLQDRLPDGVTVDGKFYKMDFSFRNVFRMMEILDSENLLPEAKAYNALHCLCKRPKNVLKVLEAVIDLLFSKTRKKGCRVTDFVQDAGLIRAAFLQAYGIDLYRQDLHYIQFIELLQAIPEGTRYSDVVGIRARPIPEPTKWNRKEREWLIQAKASVALEVDEKQRMEKYRQDVSDIASALMVMAKKKDVKNDE